MGDRCKIQENAFLLIIYSTANKSCWFSSSTFHQLFQLCTTYHLATVMYILFTSSYMSPSIEVLSHNT